MKYRNLILLLLLLITVYSSHAVERWYTVEVIIFSYNSASGLQEEHWPEDPGQPDLSNTVSLVSTAGAEIPGQPIEFQTLPIRILANSLAALNRSGRYRVIESLAWRLPGLRAGSAPPVHIQAGKFYTETGLTTSAPTEPGQAADSFGLLFNRDDTQQRQTILRELEGSIRISLSRFLDVDADLLYRSPVSLPDETGQYVSEFRSFRLKEFRRMKSNTIHYLDHPMFGMVIAIDRYGQE